MNKATAALLMFAMATASASGTDAATTPKKPTFFNAFGITICVIAAL